VEVHALHNPATEQEDGQKPADRSAEPFHAPLPPAGLVAGRAFLPALVISWLGLIAAVVSGSEWLAALALGLGLCNDWASRRAAAGPARVLAIGGARASLRAMARSIAVAATTGVAAEDESLPVILYGLTALSTHATWLLCNALIGLLFARAPALGVRNIGDRLDLRALYWRLRRHRQDVLYALLLVEWLVVVGLAVALASARPALVSAWVAGAGVALLAAAGGAMLLSTWRFLSGGRIEAYGRALFDELEAYDPEVVVYMSGEAAHVGYMLNPWLPAFEAVRKRVLIVVREEANVVLIADTPLPVVYTRLTRDVERIVLPNVKVALYVANAGRNVHLLREPGIKHVFLNHGDSDKSTSANPVSRVYDEVWVAGQAAVDRYEAAGVIIPPERFALIGRPQVDGLPVGPRPPSERHCVLYAPTWEGYYEESNYSSLEVAGPRIVAAILEARRELGIIFKPHPSTGLQRRGMRAAREKIDELLRQSAHPERHLIAAERPELTLTDCFARADVLISDISSVVTDFLHTERPIVTSNPRALSHDEFQRMFPTQMASYVLDPDLTELLALLDDALGEDSLADTRLEMKRYVLGDLPHGPIEAFRENVDRLYAQGVKDAVRVRNTFTFSSPAAP